MAADLLGQQPGLVVADIARGRADEAGHRVLFHVLAHVDGDERVNGVEQLAGQLLDQLGLADAGGADEDKAGRAVTARQVGAGALDGPGHGVDSLVLADDVRLEGILQPLQAAILGLFDLHSRYTGPKLNDLCDVVHGHFNFRDLQLQGGQLFALLRQIGLDRGQCLVVDGSVLAVLRLGVLQFVLAGLQIGHGALGLHELCNFRMAQVAAGAGFIQQVNGLVRQETVRDVAFRQLDDARHDGVGHTDAVVLFIVDADALDDFDGVQQRRFLDLDGLKTALQRGILLDILAILGKRRCADDLHLPAGQRGLHDVGGVHRAVGVARADDGVDLINKQDDVARSLDLADEALDTLLKLAAELGACDEGRHVEQVNFLVLQTRGDLALGNALGDALGNRSLADTGLADQAGVVLLAAAQNLDRAVNFAVTANDAVRLAVAGLLGQVLAVGLKELAAGSLFLLAVFGLGVVLILARTKAKREHGAAARDKIVLRGGLVTGVGVVAVHHGGQHAGVGGLLQKAGHPLLHVFQILVGHAELFHQIIHRLDVHGTGAGQAVALLHGLAVFKPLHKHDSGTFLAFNTKHLLHLYEKCPIRGTWDCDKLL